MPYAAPLACNAPGCHGVKPCPRHPRQTRKPWSHKEPSRHVRGYGSAWDSLRKIVLQRDNHCCYLCGSRANRVDHVKPKAQGGTDHPSNLRAICLRCDRSKSAREGAAGFAKSKSLGILAEDRQGCLRVRGRKLFTPAGGARGSAFGPGGGR